MLFVLFILFVLLINTQPDQVQSYTEAFLENSRPTTTFGKEGALWGTMECRRRRDFAWSSYGMSGARTVAHALAEGKHVVTTLCVGGGMGSRDYLKPREQCERLRRRSNRTGRPLGVSLERRA